MKSNLSLEETLKYNFKEASNIISINNLRGDNWLDFERQMLARQKLFIGRAKNLTAHIFLSPSIEDGKIQTLLDWKEIGQRFLEKANLIAYQSIVFLHNDTGHIHIHIVVNRIDKNGLIYRDKNELAMSQRIGDEIARERGLIRASVVRNERLQNRSKATEKSLGAVAKIKVELLNTAKNSLDSEGRFVSEKYFDQLKATGYEVKLFFKKAQDGRLTTDIGGYSVGKKGFRPIKASSISADITIRKLKETKFPIISDVQTKTSIKAEVWKMLSECTSAFIKSQKIFDPQIYFEVIRSKGHIVKEYFQSDTTILRGYGIEKDGIVVNASEIAVEFTLKSLKQQMQNFHNPNEQPQVIYTETLHRLHDKPEQQDVSKEIIRAIDMSTIESELKNITKGHRYNSYDAFVKAIENKGYRVHLRYLKGQLKGYTIHFGAEHYHDYEIGIQKEFSLNQLVEKGVFNIQRRVNNEIQNPIAGTFKPSEKPISVSESTTVNKITIAKKNTPATDAVRVISASEKEKIRKRVESELSSHSKAIIGGNKHFDQNQYFDRLKKNGFKLTEHFMAESKIIRGYSVTKYGVTFQASDIGKEFTLTSLQSDQVKSDNDLEPRIRF